MNEKIADIDWLVPLAIMVGFAALIARTATLVVGYIVVALAAGIAVAFARFIFWLIRSIVQREQRPWAAFKEILHENRFRALCAVLGILIAAIGMSAFSAMKSRLPAAVPFYADLSLANFDYWLFGQDAWRSFDAWFGSVAYPISAIYGYWLPIHCIAFTAVVLSRPSPLKSQAIIAFGLMWLFLGLCFAYAFSSAGPIFYDRIYGGHRFADLNTSVQPYFGVHRAAEYLWGRYMSGDISFGGGISAMPSIHVAGTLWLALIIQRAAPRLAPIGWAYLAIMYLGSVMLGWHYATDGLVGMAGLLVMWALAGQIASWRQIPALRRLVPHAF